MAIYNPNIYHQSNPYLRVMPAHYSMDWKIYRGNGGIKKVTFNNPATIIEFEDGIKTVVKTTDGDKYNPIMGFLLAHFEKTSGMSKTQCRKYLENLEEEHAEQLERKMKKRSKKNK